MHYMHNVYKFSLIILYYSGSFADVHSSFPYRNKLNNLICDTGKMHSIKYASKDIARWGDTDNTNVEAPELAHKNWIKQQGGKTNQGPAQQKSMMIHTLRKEASALCCEAVQGLYCIIGKICIKHVIYIKCVIVIIS